MPPSSRRGRVRRADDDLKSEDEPEAVNTPSRKRRKQDTPDRAEAELARASATRKRVSDISQASLSEEDAAEEIVRNFRVAKHPIQARTDHANEKHEVEYPAGKTAYAKISGNGWTYYVTEIEVRIGRPPDERYEPSHDGSESPNDRSLVHIDLGPSKLVSRQHAEIRYDADSWTVTVIGRHGVKLDEEPLPRGTTRAIHSGSVIEIAGTQMMFVTPSAVPKIHPHILAQARVSEEDDEDDERFRPPPKPSRGNGPNPSTGKDDIKSHDGASDSRMLSSASGMMRSPGYGRGLFLESTEDIDYAEDAAKDIKPPHSYAQLIGMAILSDPEEKVTLSKIYDWIKERYAYYRISGGGWQVSLIFDFANQNSIRHNLSLNKCFEKVARRTDEPGKGMKWQIVAEHRGEFMKRSFSGRSKGRSSAPSSPVKEPAHEKSFLDNKPLDNPFAHTTSKTHIPYIKTSPGSTSPSGPYYLDKIKTTPDSAKNSSFKLGSSPIGISPFPDLSRKHPFAGLNEAASSRTPGGLALHSGGTDASEPLATPLISRRMPHLAPPSAAHLPSQFMPLSSPAPFWKYASEFQSSPAKAAASSPVKAELKSSASPETKARPAGLGGLAALDPDGPSTRSSSPPSAGFEVDVGSPTRAVTRSKAAQVSPVAPAAATMSAPPAKLGARPNMIAPAAPTAHPHTLTRAATPPRASSRPLRGPAGPGASNLTDDDSDGDEPAIDLAKGFQPIGSFHRSMNTSAVRG